jgi:lipid-A-disaccharide synthase
MVVAYRVAPLTAWLVRTFRLMRTGLYALPNVLAGEQLVPELMQEQATPEALSDAVLRWFAEPARRTTIESRFRTLHGQLRRGADREAAAAVAESIGAR